MIQLYKITVDKTYLLWWRLGIRKWGFFGVVGEEMGNGEVADGGGLAKWLAINLLWNVGNVTDVMMMMMKNENDDTDIC